MAKRLLFLFISQLVGIGDALVDGVRRLAGGARRSRCVVLAYHAVTDHERARFARQMDVLKQRTTPVPADISALPATGGRFVAITFDDGFENIARNAIPELAKRGIPSTLFIVTEALGTARAWEHYGGDDTREEPVMSAERLASLQSDLVTIGSHTMTHPMLPKVDGATAFRELDGSRASLEKLLNRPVTLLSFPYGAFNDSVVAVCREARYKRVFTALPVYAFQGRDEFITGRAGASPMDWPIEFRLKLEGAYRWLPKAFAMKRWVLSTVRPRAAKAVAVDAQEKTIA